MRIYWLLASFIDLKPSIAPRVEMLKELEKKGNNVVLVTSYKNTIPELPLNVCYLNILKNSLFARFLFNVMSLFFIINELKHREDVLLIADQNSLYGALGAKLLTKLSRRKRFRIHFDIRTIPVEINGIKGRVETFIFWKIPIFLAKLFLTSFSFVTKAVREAAGFNKVDGCIWSSGVNLEKFDPAKFPVPKKERFTLFYHGVITPNRGLRETLEAVKIVKNDIPDLLFSIAGDGSDLGYLQELAERKGISQHIEFIGKVDYKEIPSYINGADVCICPLPDIVWWRVSSPLKVMEYLAMGKPCILTAIPPHRSIFEGDTRGIYWAGTGRPEEIADAILKSYRDGALSVGHLSALREKVSHYTWSRQAEILQDYLVEKVK